MDREQLFGEVADLAEPARRKFYDDHGVSPELRAEMESLLSFDSSGLDSRPAYIAAVAEQAFQHEAGAFEGLRCGPYVLQRPLGRGGMGTVFLAHRADGEVRQTVAVKLLNVAVPDSAFTSRFLQERQILASLNHPGITRLLDAGHTADGRPYLAMERVDGVPIDVYCRHLPTRRIVELLLEVGDALAYAHRNLIVHRDLKPSNILVDPAGHPKLLDFGIARILDPDAGGALTKDRFLTPDFASPEQLRGDMCTTATDIYSLAAVLYFLLTGHSPAPHGRPDSTLPRDLVFVLRKALRAEPEDRYPSATAFAEDLRAFLELRPVRARSGNAWYLARRFVRRHWIPVSALVLALAGLSAGIYTAERGRALAQRRFADLRELANQMLRFDSELQGLPGSTRARQHIVTAGMQYLDRLASQAAGDTSLSLEVAGGYLQLGQVQGVPTMSNLGDFAGAALSLEKAGKAVDVVLQTSPRNLDALMLRAEISMDRMILADSQNRDSEAESWGRACVATLDLIRRTLHPSPQQIRDMTTFYVNAGLSFMNRHEPEDAIRNTRQAVAMARAGADSRDIAVGLSLLANILRQSGDLDGALSAITESRAVAETVSFHDPNDRALILYIILWRQGQILGSDEEISLGRADDAIEPLRRAFDLMEQQASKDPADATSRDRLATAAWQLGDVLRHRDPREALAVFDRAIARQRELPGNVLARHAEARLLARSSYALRDLDRGAEARERIGRALALLAAGRDYPAPSVQPGGVAEAAVRALADQQIAAGQRDRAIATYRDLLDREMASHPHPDRDLRQAASLSRLYQSLERLYAASGNHREAANLNGQRRELWLAWNRKLPSNPYIQRQLDAAAPRS